MSGSTKEIIYLEVDNDFLPLDQDMHILFLMREFTTTKSIPKINLNNSIRFRENNSLRLALARLNISPHFPMRGHPRS